MTAGLVACGGGGGGETAATLPATPVASQPVIAGTLTASPAACVVSEGAGDCVVTLNVATTGATAPVVLGQDGMNYSASSMLPITVQIGEQQKFELKDGSTVVASVLVSASCVDGTTLDPASKRCAKPVTPTQVFYDRVNILITGEVIADSGNGTLAVAYPQILSGTTLTPVKNETGFQVGLCALTSMKLPDNGLPGAWCTKPSNGNVRGLFPIDPVRGALLPEYTGTVPAEMLYYAAFYGDFGASPYSQFGVSHFGMFIDAPGVGTYYYPDNSVDELRLTRDGFATSELIRAGQYNELLMSYSNPAPPAN